MVDTEEKRKTVKSRTPKKYKKWTKVGTDYWVFSPCELVFCSIVEYIGTPNVSQTRYMWAIANTNFKGESPTLDEAKNEVAEVLKKQAILIIQAT
jgi:hypothetical protein